MAHHIARWLRDEEAKALPGVVLTVCRAVPAAVCLRRGLGVAAVLHGKLGGLTLAPGVPDSGMSGRILAAP